MKARILPFWLVALGLLASRGEAQLPGGTELRLISTPEPVWYASRQLRKPVVLQLEGLSAESCGEASVGTQASGDGLVSPEAAVGVWSEGRCTVEVSWTLSDQIGRQHLTATVIGDEATDPLIIEAMGRQGARVFFGAAYTPREEAHTALGTAADGTTTIEQVDPKAAFRPVLGVDFAPWPSWERVRLAVGTGARDFDRQFFFGFSVMQAFVFGQPSEGATVDLHAGFQLTRRDVAIAGATCGDVVVVCTDSDLRFSGFALFLGVDGASAFRGLAGTILR